MDYLKNQIVDYLSRKKFLTLATSSSNGKPLTHPIAYVNNESDVYFSTSKQTRKAKNIQENPNVAYSIYNETEFFDEIKAIQMEGTATIVSDKKEFEEALKMLNQKFPYMANMQLDKDSLIIKITPKLCYFSDHVKRFGQRDKVEY